MPAGTFLEGFEFNPENKRCHYWIYGASNTGKSTLLAKVMKTCRAYQGPYNGDWVGFNPSYHDVIVFDEFKG